MKQHKFLLVTLFSLQVFIWGCGSLDVKVGVLNPHYLDKYKSQDRVQLSFVLSLDDEIFLSEKNEMIAKLRAYYISLSKEYEKRGRELERNRKDSGETLLNLAESKDPGETLLNLAESKDPGETLLNLAESWKKYADNGRSIQLVDAYVRNLQLTASKIRDEFNKHPPDSRKAMLSGGMAIPPKLKHLLDDYKYGASYLSKAIKQEIEKDSYELQQLSPANKQHIQKIKAVATQQTIMLTEAIYGPTGQGIGEDPLAYFVATAPDDQWGHEYNLAVAESYFGNVDIAIVINKFGNYTVKGVVFDPSDVAALVTKVATQTLIIAAQGAGVPVKAPVKNKEGENFAASSSVLHDTMALNRRRENQLKKQRKAIKEIALAIINQREKVEGGDDDVSIQKRLGAIKAIYNTYKNYGGLLIVKEISSSK